MEREFIVFGSPKIEQREIDEVIDSMKSGWLGTGPKVAHFENMFKQYKGSQYALAVNSCTAALHLSMLVVGIKPGDEVIVPAMTFAATANSVIHAGGKPVFADCDRRTMNIMPEDIKRKITKKTRAIVPVHFAGRMCDMPAIKSIAQEHDLRIIEDCAHAIETAQGGKKAGTIGDLGCLSFYVTKNIVTGEGGMIITDNEKYANRIKNLALHGMSKDAWQRFSDTGYKHYQVVECGYKYNMMDLQAAIGIHQLSNINAYWERRRHIWRQYQSAFEKYPVFLPPPSSDNETHAYHLYTLLLDIDKLSITRDQFLAEMTKRRIGVGVHYIALNLHPFYQEAYGYRAGDFENAEWVSERTVSLPLSPKLTDSDVEYIVSNVRQVLERSAR